MILSVKLAEDAIVVVLGSAGKRVVVQDCCIYILPQGTLINDVITDERQFKIVLEEIKKKYSRYKGAVHLLLGSNQIITKIMQVPPMSGNQLMYTVEKELQPYKGEWVDLVYDYSVIRRENIKNRGGTILGAAIEREKIRQFKSLFEESGMRIKTINIAANAMLQLMERLPDLAGGTYILSILDGRNMLSTLYIDGIYVHTGRSRFLYDRGSGEFLAELRNEIGALVHFGNSLGRGPINQTLYFGGLSDYEREHLGVESKPIETPNYFRIADGIDYKLKDYFYATGNLFGKQGIW